MKHLSLVFRFKIGKSGYTRTTFVVRAVQAESSKRIIPKVRRYLKISSSKLVYHEGILDMTFKGIYHHQLLDGH